MAAQLSPSVPAMALDTGLTAGRPAPPRELEDAGKEPEQKGWSYPKMQPWESPLRKERGVGDTPFWRQEVSQVAEGRASRRPGRR